MIPRLWIVFLLCYQFLAGQNLKSGGRLSSDQANMDIRHYTIALEIDTLHKSIEGYTIIDLILEFPTSLLILDLYKELTVTNVLVNGINAYFKQSDLDQISIISGTNIPWSERTSIKIAYGGQPAIALRAPWVGGFTWSRDTFGIPWMAISCQSEGGKIFFPCKDHPSDEPNEGADLIITVPKGLVVGGPGLLKSVNTKKNKSTYHWSTQYTISNYCLVFNIGNYKKVSRPYTTILGNQVPMEYYVLVQNEAKAQHQLEMLERTCHILEKYFGEYPFAKEKIGLIETPHLGMEHQTMIAYGNKYRYSQVGGQDFDWLLNHEFGHEWWANKVTNIDWAHMWIQEGICSFGDALYYREMEGEDAYLKVMQQRARNAQNKLPIVQGDEIDSDQAYHSDIYGKAAFFMHSLRYLIGDDIFFSTLKELATEARYTYDHMINTDNVRDLFMLRSGQDLKQFFHLYLKTTNKLEISVRNSAENKYVIKLNNYKGDLPIDIRTSEGIQKVSISDKEIIIQSASLPVIDENVYYLKKIIWE